MFNVHFEMKKIAVIVFLLLSTYTLYAYPISPCPLRCLIEKSQYIVYASVIDVVAVSDEKWNGTKAILLIGEIYQGTVPKDTIEVYFSRQMECPEPAHYEKGTTVLAFLYKEKRNVFYETQALSYGSKKMTPQGLVVYKARILEMQEINKIKNAQAKKEQTIDWLIRCATNPSTRWEGVYELEPESGFIGYYDRGKDTLVSINHLSESQLTTLRQSLFSIDTIDHDVLDLADIVEKKSDTELLNFLATKLKETKLKGWRIREYTMQRIAKLSGRTDLKKIYLKVHDLDYNYPHDQYDEIFSKLYKEFVELL